MRWKESGSDKLYYPIWNVRRFDAGVPEGQCRAVDSPKWLMSPRRMGRIAGRGKKRWGRLTAALALAAAVALQGIGSARMTGGEVPHIPYFAYPSDDRLTLAGRLVRPEAEIRQLAL